MKKVAIDVMGGDYAPRETVAGALAAADKHQIPVVLVGDEAAVLPLVQAAGMQGHPLIEIQHASQVIGMDEHPGMAYRKKKDASIVVGARLVKEGKCGALVAPGSTGAAVTAGLFGLGRIKGIDRPAIATPIPTVTGGVVILIDSGASASPDEKNMLQNAIIGNAYSRAVYGLESPRVGLLNIGTEEIKGSPLVVSLYPQMQKQQMYRFVGNIEGRDITTGNVDVVVCDGFTGNVVLKFGEGLATMFFTLLKKVVEQGGIRAKIGSLLLKPALKRMVQAVDYAEYGGAPLLGVKGGLVICHGASKAKAIENAVRQASKMAESNILEEIEKSILVTENKEEK